VGSAAFTLRYDDPESLIMTDQASRFAGGIPARYDSGLGPYLFVDYAIDLAQRTAACKPSRVLELAAGTGIVTRLLRDALPSASELIASDLNPPMLEIARRKFAGGEKIEFRRADATALPFRDEEFDAVVCQFGVMFFPDKAKAYHEVHRVLTRGGTYHFNVWDSFAFNPFARITQDTVGRFFREDAPIFYTVPFGYHRIDDIKASLIEAGFNDIAAHVLSVDKTIAKARQFAEGLILGNPIVEEIQTRGTVDPEAIVTALTAALQDAFGADPGSMPLQAIVFRACKR
jgi:ubiquinone/menaquinone biosynthesis C-methylase UbiE